MKNQIFIKYIKSLTQYMIYRKHSSKGQKQKDIKYK